jgi:uncharacterized repeat protein (TIGR01451 family)
MTQFEPHVHRANTANAPLGAGCAALVVLLICSCQSIPNLEIPTATGEAVVVSDEGPLEEVPAGKPTASAVEKTPCVPIEPVFDEGPPMPIVNISPWAPPGLETPWPYDEYLHDGGDSQVQVNLGAEGEVHGLEPQDTVMIYDTIDGRTEIKPSNRVCLYAPRFAAVRHVTSVVENLQNDQLTAVSLPVMPQLNQEDRLANTAVQPIRPEGEISTKQPSIERTNEVVTPTISLQPILGIEGGYATYENLLVMRRGIFGESEKTRLMEAIDAAITWTDNKAVQVIINGRAAVDVTGDQRVQATYRIDVPNSPCLRVIKIASKKVAKPGEIVDFTIRFDNLGDQRIEHVVLIDNLTTRLEYVPETAQSSRRSEFSTKVNDSDSLELRWDFVDPLPAGEGGLVRFNCRVR